MKKIKIILLAAFLMMAMKGIAQNANRQHYAEKVTIKMRDSLHLSKEQTREIFELNKRIEIAKDSVWKRFSNDNAIRKALQAIENKRDSLYKTVFTKEQFSLYQEKKNHLINNK